jgi:tetratricopeptide (TPR) repeat protein
MAGSPGVPPPGGRLQAREPLDLRGRGQVHARKAEWAKAAECYRQLADGEDGHALFEYAALMVLAGDDQAYRRACARLSNRCEKSKSVRRYHAARAFTLAPDTAKESAVAVEKAAAELSRSNEFWSLTEQGALALRAGRAQEAVPLFEQSLAADSKPGHEAINWLWLALANHHLGKPDEARRWLGQAVQWLDQQGGSMLADSDATGLDIHGWLELHILRREAEALLGAAAPGAPARP